MTDIVGKNQANIAEGVHVACVYDLPRSNDSMHVRFANQHVYHSYFNKVLLFIFVCII